MQVALLRVRCEDIAASELALAAAAAPAAALQARLEETIIEFTMYCEHVKRKYYYYYYYYS